MELKQNLKWAFIFLLIIAVSALILFIHKPSAGKVAKIIQNGVTIREVDLLGGETEFTVTSEDGGENTIRIEKGQIGITSASCPDQICVKRGFTDNAIPPIVCLPNKLSIVISENNSGIDAVTGGVNR